MTSLQHLSIRPHLLMGAIVLWAIVTTPIAVHVAVVGDRWWALAALAAGPAAFLVRSRPVVAAGLLVAGATVLRMAFLGWSYSDPLEVSLFASDRAFAGFDPYGGFLYPASLTPTPYPYGPLGLVTYRLGIPGEMVAVIATSALLIWQRAWITLAFFNAWPQLLLSPAIGNNDYSVGLLLLGSLLMLPAHRKLGMGLLAISTAIKPYAAAWFIPAIGFAGVGAGITGVLVFTVLWSPVIFIWGVPSFAASYRELESALKEQAVQSQSSWAFADFPLVRLVALPVGLVGLLVTSWRGAVLLGSLVFIIFLGFAPSAHAGYLGALIPVAGLALESQRDQPKGSVACS